MLHRRRPQIYWKLVNSFPISFGDFLSFFRLNVLIIILLYTEKDETDKLCVGVRKLWQRKRWLPRGAHALGSAVRASKRGRWAAILYIALDQWPASCSTQNYKHAGDGILRYWSGRKPSGKNHNEGMYWTDTPDFNFPKFLFANTDMCLPA